MVEWHDNVNWSEYHPEAQSILDDPLFWDETNDYAPHGSDDGADTFYSYRAWRAAIADEDSKIFLENMLNGWGINSYREDAEDTLIDQMRDAAQISLAFAHVKMDGTCPAWARDLALSSIDRRYKYSAQDERRRTLNVMKLKLQSL